VTVYLTAQVVGVLFAVGVAYALLSVDVPVWGAAGFWLAVSVYLSRKRLPSEALGTGLQFGAVVAVLVPPAPYVGAAVEGAAPDAVTVAREMFGPALLFLVFAAFAYVVGLLLKRRAKRKLTKRARKDVYQSG